MAKLGEIVGFLDQELQLQLFPDGSLNGLQFEGRQDILRIAAAVDTALSVIESALDQRADLLIVHHGMFWGKPQAVTGAERRIFQRILAADLSLYCAHLPLDAHQVYGNNFLLARFVGLSELSAAPGMNYSGPSIACLGTNVNQLLFAAFEQALHQLPGAAEHFVSLPFGPKVPQRVCVVSGAGADQLLLAESLGFDTLITGEPRHFAYHYCKAHNLNAVFAGHYATETLGVQELGKAAAAKFGAAFEFIDHPTGI